GTPINNWAGVLSVTINGISQKAFCTDINNEIRRGCNSNSTFGATDPLVACTLQYFPPVAGLSSDEAAARQATIWYFSDDFSMTSPSGVKSIHEEQVAFILAQYEAGLCGALPTPSLTIDPSSAVNFLVPDGS